MAAGAPPLESGKELKREIQEVFHMFDEDGSGTIDGMELQAAISTITGQEMTREEALQLVQKVDKDGDGLVDFNEFYEMVSSKMCVASARDEAKAAFKLFESMETPGRITIESLRRVAHELGERCPDAKLDEMIRAVSTTDDGTVDFAAFLATQVHGTPAADADAPVSPLSAPAADDGDAAPG